MATKKDLIEAHGFSRRRLLSAFTGGAPGGKELDPAKPLRAVIAGVALSVMVVLAGVFYGIIRPGLPQGWENDRLVIAGDTGARYLSIDGVLFPVVNTASARLLVPAGEFSVVTTDHDTLAGIEIGPSIGIVGAPDDLPAAERLVNDGWVACVDPGARTAVAIADTRLAEPATASAAVVERGDELFVVAGALRHAVPRDEADAVLRAIGLGSAPVVAVEGRWLNLFEPGSDLAPLHVDGAGDRIAGSELVAGTVVHPQGSDADERYLVTERGELAPIGPLAYQLYLLGTGASAGVEVEVSPASISSMPTAAAAGADDWPVELLQALEPADTTCAVLDEGRAVLGTSDAELAAARDGVTVSVGNGALVRAGSGPGAAGIVYLVDESGTAYPVAGDAEELVARLGYSSDDVGALTADWMQFFAIGPELSSEAAGASVIAQVEAAE